MSQSISFMLFWMKKILMQIWGIGCDQRDGPEQKLTLEDLFTVGPHLPTHPSVLPLVQDPCLFSRDHTNKFAS